MVKKVEKYFLNKKIKNFKLVKKGEVIACNDKKNMVAKESFYPILFDDKSYENIFGFKAIKE